MKVSYREKPIRQAYLTFELMIRYAEITSLDSERSFEQKILQSEDEKIKKLRIRLAIQWKHIFYFASWSETIPHLVLIMNAEQKLPGSHQVFTKALLCHEKEGMSWECGRDKLPGLVIDEEIYRQPNLTFEYQR
jgi:hypothetical protein